MTRIVYGVPNRATDVHVLWEGRPIKSDPAGCGDTISRGSLT
jgi:hypothetical protein